jgi:hypothetical protein
MLKPRNMHKIADQMLKTHLQIIALQEMIWKESGKLKKNKHSLYYSYSHQNTGQMGTGSMVKREIVRNIISFQPCNENICKLRFRGKYHNLTLISVHAPTGDKDIRVKEQIYDDLQWVYENIAKHDAVNINTKISKEQVYSRVFGRYTCMILQTRMVKWCATLQSRIICAS